VAAGQDIAELVLGIVDQPSASNVPTYPNRMQAVGISLALGVLLGVGLALLRNWLDQRVTSAEEVSALLGVPVVGMLPRVKGKQDTARLGRHVLEDPSSGIAEAYRGIRTALSFGLRGIRAKTILVTSPAPKEGKSTMVSNLAVSMAQAGQRVLIVDADLRQSQQHAIFSVSNDVGLANVLTGEAPLAQAIQHFDSIGLDILPAGHIHEHSHEMLSSRALADLMGSLSERYDFILIDSPPLTSVADPLVLAAISDVTVLVVRWGLSRRKAAEQARDGLAGMGARVVGAVVTGVRGGAGHYYSYYGYHARRQNGVKAQDIASAAVAEEKK
jgi:capsular exopolysaccharide synthesis family protein